MSGGAKPSLRVHLLFALLYTSFSLSLRARTERTPVPRTVLSSDRVWRSVPFSSTCYLVTQDVKINPRTWVVSTSETFSQVTSVAFPFIPALPSSIRVWDSPFYSGSSLEGIYTSQCPAAVYFFSRSVYFTDSEVNNAPVPPPVEGAFFPSTFSCKGPFPENPVAKVVSPTFDLRGSSIPIFNPIAQWAAQDLPFSLSVSRVLVKHKDDLLPSIMCVRVGYPNFTSFTTSMLVRVL